MHILPNTTSIYASVNKETYQPKHKIITADPYAKKKKKINKQNWVLGWDIFEKKKSMFV